MIGGGKIDERRSLTAAAEAGLGEFDYVLVTVGDRLPDEVLFVLSATLDPLANTGPLP